jgi:hypothetical protein
VTGCLRVGIEDEKGEIKWKIAGCVVVGDKMRIR